MKYKCIEDELKKLGIKAELIRNKRHLIYRIETKDGLHQNITAPKSPSDRRALQNFRATLRKYTQ